MPYLVDYWPPIPSASNPAAVAKLKAAGGASVETAKVAASRADVVITMLPSGKEVRDVYLGKQAAA